MDAEERACQMKSVRSAATTSPLTGRSWDHPLLIATALVLAIRTAKWPATFSRTTVNPELDAEIEYATYLASRVMSSLVAKREGLFPQKREPWYQATDEDVPK